MKTTQIGRKERIIGYEDGIPIKEDMPQERLFAADEVVVDTRRLPVDGADYCLPPVGGDIKNYWIDDKEKWPGLVQMYHHAHAFCFPSMGEGFGLTLAEAMATGLPVIVPRMGGSYEVAGERALAYQPYNSQELAQLIEQLINDQELYIKYSRYCLNRANKFDWVKTTAKYVEMYMRLINN